MQHSSRRVLNARFRVLSFLSYIIPFNMKSEFIILATFIATLNAAFAFPQQEQQQQQQPPVNGTQPGTNSTQPPANIPGSSNSTNSTDMPSSNTPGNNDTALPAPPQSTPAPAPAPAAPVPAPAPVALPGPKDPIQPIPANMTFPAVAKNETAFKNNTSGGKQGNAASSLLMAPVMACITVATAVIACL